MRRGSGQNSSDRRCPMEWHAFEFLSAQHGMLERNAASSLPPDHPRLSNGCMLSACQSRRSVPVLRQLPHVR